jgi:diguanylate cyclase (GGDEF)-like protein/PAS domain S-box-containing protein
MTDKHIHLAEHIGLLSIIDQIGFYIYVKDMAGRYLYANQRVQELFGASFDTIVGQDDSAFFNLEITNETQFNDARVIKHGDTLECEERTVVKSTGEERTYWSVKKPMYNQQSEIVGMCGISTDITASKVLEKVLQTKEQRLREAQQISHIGSWELDLISGVSVWSDETFRLLEMDKDVHLATLDNLLAAIHPDDLEAVKAAYLSPLVSEEPKQITHRLLLSDGQIKWVNQRFSAYLNYKGNPLRTVGTIQDVTERVHADKALRIAATAFETHDAIMITNATDTTILRVNQAFQKVTGYHSDEVVGQNPRILYSGRHSANFYTEMWRQLVETGEWEGEIWDRRKCGQIYPKWLTITAVKNTYGETSEYVAIFRDITELKQNKEDLHRLAFYDELTKLPNRHLLQDRLQQVAASNTQKNLPGALLFIGLDYFKTLNDTKGRKVGDLLLQQVAERIQACLRESDTLARLGGDEFVVIQLGRQQDHKNTAVQAEQLGRRVLEALNRVYFLAGHEHYSSASIGITVFNEPNNQLDELLKQANIAMSEAKIAGRNDLRFFNLEMQNTISNRVAIERELHHAITNNQFQLYYQIQLDNDYLPLGAEALIRWIHPERGMVSPAEFIPIAEASSLILDIGYWVLDCACQQLAKWSKHETSQNLILAINVSARQFAMPNFFDSVKKVIRIHGIKASRLKLELTESVILIDVEDVVAKMHALKAIGVRLSLDDFGTDYSSLSYLKKLPFDQLKIDQSFVQDIVRDPNDAMMVKTIIELGRNFCLNVIAEGVETEAQFQFLKQNGCMAYQGYLFSKPLSIENFEQLLTQD